MIDDSIKAKAVALLNEILTEKGFGRETHYPHIWPDNDAHQALCRAIEQHEYTKAAHAATVEGILQSHEAFKQKVSDAVKDACKFAKENSALWAEHLAIRFSTVIDPKPKPDPLVDVAKSLGYFNTVAQHWAGDVRAALDALGFEIREKDT